MINIAEIYFNIHTYSYIYPVVHSVGNCYYVPIRFYEPEIAWALKAH
jgi:hypothetical protein